MLSTPPVLPCPKWAQNRFTLERLLRRPFVRGVGGGGRQVKSDELKRPPLAEFVAK